MIDVSRRTADPAVPDFALLSSHKWSYCLLRSSHGVYTASSDRPAGPSQHVKTTCFAAAMYRPPPTSAAHTSRCRAQAGHGPETVASSSWHARSSVLSSKVFLVTATGLLGISWMAIAMAKTLMCCWRTYSAGPLPVSDGMMLSLCQVLPKKAEMHYLENLFLAVALQGPHGGMAGASKSFLLLAYHRLFCLTHCCFGQKFKTLLGCTAGTSAVFKDMQRVPVNVDHEPALPRRDL